MYIEKQSGDVIGPKIHYVTMNIITLGKLTKKGVEKLIAQAHLCALRNLFGSKLGESFNSLVSW